MQEQACQRAELACEPGQLGLIGLELELDLPHEHAKIQMPDQPSSSWTLFIMVVLKLNYFKA